ncbi:hypothetical protein BX600DRAFT_514519 [Xylariales sp. PMI_506]|nr:hypothetical protein BX600DRAFT_514519 [Xylariales sp. PMI_506]
MHSVAVTAAFLGLAGLGAAEHHNHHRHAHLHERQAYEATVTTIVTDWVTEYVYPDSTTSSTTSSSAAAIFIQEVTTSSTTSTTSSTSSSTSTSTTPTSTSTSSTPVATTLHTSTYVATTAAASVNSNERTFTIVNSHTTGVTTSHDDTYGTPTSAGAVLTPGTLAAGATATFAVPVNWVGNIGYNEEGYEVTSDSSLIEANYAEWFGVPRADMDISFVNGFTLPATCSCAGTTVTGCNLDLTTLSSCPSSLVENACVNPLRSDELAVAATSFFEPCEGAAWTYVNDGNADSNCQSGDIICCIGTACPANPKQSSS